MIITPMQGESVRELLDTGKIKTVLLVCHHGLGDAITVYNNILPVLRERYPNITFYMDTHRGQKDLCGYPDDDTSHYDLTIILKLPCSEWDVWSNETKAERSLRLEFGLDNIRQPDTYHNPRYESPLVGMQLKSISSRSLHYNETDAYRLWNAIKDVGLIPLDMQFAHQDAKLIQHPYPFQDRNIHDIKPNVKTLFGLMGAVSGFAGVSSGDFWVALSVLPPQTILYLENDFDVRKLTRLPVHHMHIYNEKVVAEWLDDINNYGNGNPLRDY